MTHIVRINGHIVSAVCKVDYYRLGVIGTTAEVALTIDGQRSPAIRQYDEEFTVMYAHANGDTLELVTVDDYKWEYNNAAVAWALGITVPQRTSLQMRQVRLVEVLDHAMSSVRAIAQTECDALLASIIWNEDEAPIEDMVTGFVMECGAHDNGKCFVCSGDGYLTLFHAKESARRAMRFRLNRDLVRALTTIHDETHFWDVSRSTRVWGLLYRYHQWQSPLG